MTRAKLIFVFFMYVGLPKIQAQQSQYISGRILDSLTHEPIPYATVRMKQGGGGVLSDDHGYFKLPVLAAEDNDTLVASSMGYHSKFTSLSRNVLNLNILLHASVAELAEVVVTPLTPQEYLLRFLRHLPHLVPGKRYNMTGKYYEKILENDVPLKHDEAIFKSYHPVRKDSMRMQCQILLYKQGPGIAPMQFMKPERHKQEEKERLKALKEKKDPPQTGIDFIFMSAGPLRMLRFGGINSWIDDYLDSNQFKNFDYTFASTPQQSADMVVISFKSKGVVHHVEKSGRIFIHLPTSAVMKIEGEGNYVVPVFLRPLLFLYGFSARDLLFTGRKEYQFLDGKMYLKSVAFKATGNVSKRRWFSVDEKARYQGEQLCTITSISTLNPTVIQAEKKYKPYKLMEQQVYPEDGIQWEAFQ